MALPKFLQFGKSYAGKTVDLSRDTGSEIIDASQTSGSDIKLGSGATTVTAGDFDTIEAGSGTDFVYSARGTGLVVGPGDDTFVFGVGSKPQSQGMIGACVVEDDYYSKYTIEISKSFFGSNTADQMKNLAAAISSANSAAGLQSDGSRVLKIDNAGDSIQFNSGQLLDPKQFKLV